jgi:hypothetical protein
MNFLSPLVGLTLKKNCGKTKNIKWIVFLDFQYSSIQYIDTLFRSRKGFWKIKQNNFFSFIVFTHKIFTIEEAINYNFIKFKTTVLEWGTKRNQPWVMVSDDEIYLCSNLSVGGKLNMYEIIKLFSNILWEIMFRQFCNLGMVH